MPRVTKGAAKRRKHNKHTTLRGRPALDYRYRLKRPER